MSRIGILLTVLVATFVLQGCQTLEDNTRAGMRTGWHKAEKVDYVLQDYLW